jgi:symplekin
VALKSLDTLAGLINDANINTVKVAIQCLTSVYPMLFRMLYASISTIDKIAFAK